MGHLLLTNHFTRVQSPKPENTAAAVQRTVVINTSFQGSRFLSRILLGKDICGVYHKATLHFFPIFLDLLGPGSPKQF